MKTIQFFVLSLIATVTLFPNEGLSQMRAGAGLAYGTDPETLGLNLNFYAPYPEIEHLRLGGDVNFFLSKEINPFLDRKRFEINLNGQYEFYSDDMIQAYALGGFNVAREGFEYAGPGNSPYSYDARTKVGLNLGVGGEYNFNSFVVGFAELKFVLSDLDQAVITAGVRIPLSVKP